MWRTPGISEERWLASVAISCSPLEDGGNQGSIHSSRNKASLKSRVEDTLEHRSYGHGPGLGAIHWA